tara:strand:+ start:16966 stop:17073 length:108 start_codon:yes stop_codon:yes gene_type:complete
MNWLLAVGCWLLAKYDLMPNTKAKRAKSQSPKALF